MKQERSKQSDAADPWRLELSRDMTPSERASYEARLAAEAGRRAEWDSELALNRLLRDLPNAPVSSNFVTRVLQQLERTEVAPARRTVWAEGSRFVWAWRVWGRWGVAAAMVGLAVISYDRYQVSQRREWARSLAAFSGAIEPGLRVLHDLPAIEGFNQVNVAVSRDEMALLDVLP